MNIINFFSSMNCQILPVSSPTIKEKLVKSKLRTVRMYFWRHSQQNACQSCLYNRSNKERFLQIQKELVHSFYITNVDKEAKYVASILLSF